MPLKPLIRFGGAESTETLRASIREWLADNLPDEFRRTAANPDYLPRAAHERAVAFCRADGKSRTSSTAFCAASTLSCSRRA